MKYINSDNKKRYYTLDYYYKHKYGCKIAKISLNGNFSCPNKDGTKGINGCIYCSKLGSGDYAGDVSKSLTEQFFEIKKRMNKKWSNTKYIAYFQANTNTYATVNELKGVHLVVDCSDRSRNICRSGIMGKTRMVRDVYFTIFCRA